VTISFSATWFIGELDCRLGELVVGEFDCRRVGLSVSWLSASWFVGKLSSYHVFAGVGILRTANWRTSKTRTVCELRRMVIGRDVSDHVTHDSPNTNDARAAVT